MAHDCHPGGDVRHLLFFLQKYKCSSCDLIWSTWSTLVILYPWLKVHSHASHTLLCSALFEICHVSLASMCSLGCVSQLLNWLTIPIYSNFSGASPHHCALPLPHHRSQQLLRTMCHVSHTRSLVHLYPWIQYTTYHFPT